MAERQQGRQLQQKRLQGGEYDAWQSASKAGSCSKSGLREEE